MLIIQKIDGHNMKIILYDVDSLIPNIALMKLSTYHKQIGDEVNFVRGNQKPIFVDYSKYGVGYASVIFTKYKYLVENFPFHVGGTGISLKNNLPDDIEHLMPDYSLYPENEYSIGYTTRGCVRNCEFCFVPEKEGIIKFNANIDEFYDPKLKKLMLLDNNIFSYGEYRNIFEQIRKINKLTHFRGGMDFRLLNKDKVDNLLSIRYEGNYMFAYDNLKERSEIEKQMLKYRKYFKDWSLKFFVLVGFDTSLKDDIFRIMYLKNNLCLPYIMRHEKCYISEYKDFYTDLAAWCNQVFVFKKMTFEEFIPRRHANKDRIDSSLKLWKENT
jgi:hypothetical protein